MPTSPEVAGQQRRAKSGFVVPATLKELGSIVRWGIPAVREKFFVREDKNPEDRKDKIDRGVEALGIFHDNLHNLIGNSEESDAQERYEAIFGTPEAQERAREKHGTACWDVDFLGKGFNAFALRFTTPTGIWVIKVGYLHSPNPLFFIPPSDPTHSGEMRQNIEHIDNAAKKFGVANFVPHPQEVAYLSLPQYEGQAVTVQVMPFVEQLTKKELKDALQDDATAQHLLEEMEAVGQIRHHLQEEHGSEFDLTGEGNLAVVWKYASDGTRYPGLQIIDIGLRIYGLNTPITDNFFDITGFLQGFMLRRKIRRKKLRGIVEDFATEFGIIRQGRDKRTDIRLEVISEQILEAFMWGAARRGRLQKDDPPQAA